MLKASAVILIAEDPQARGVFEEPTETEREIPCVEKSLGMKMRAEAMALGMAPEIRLEIAHEAEYQGEKIALYQGQRYAVIHAYPYEKTNGLELLLQRIEGNAQPIQETEPAEENETGNDIGGGTEEPQEGTEG